MFGLFRDEAIDLVIHCAAQPSHDRARDIPFLDFEVNATGTLNLLEATRQHAPDAVFIHVSTNKVYGDAPNELELVETDTRWEYARPEDFHGISEQCRIDQTTHSLFGASKTAADILAQEYGRYFGLKTGIFRGGCLTGPSHSGVELHGFLSLPGPRGRDGQAVHDLRLQGQAGARPDPQRGRDRRVPGVRRRTRVRARSTTWAAGATTRRRCWSASS